MVTSLHYFFSTSFFAHFLDTASRLGLRATSAVLCFHTFYIVGFIFLSSWWCLRSFLALTWYNYNSASLHLAALICAPHRSSSNYFTWAIHSCHTANVSLFWHHSSTPQGGPSVFPPNLSSGHHTCSFIEHFLLAWPFPQFRVFLFAFRILKIESNHEHVRSWARKIHMTVPFHHFRVFLFAFRLLKIESNYEHELSWARKIHRTVPFYIHTSSSSLTHEAVPPRLLALWSIISATSPIRSPLFRVFCSFLPRYHSLSLPQPSELPRSRTAMIPLSPISFMCCPVIPAIILWTKEVWVHPLYLPR